MSDAKKDTNIGKVVGDYKIINFLGKGQFGKVYKASGKDKEYVAIKIIKKKKINKIDKLKELLNTEIQVMKKINHENIMKLFSYYESDNNYYLAIEYCDKGDLLQYLEKQNNNFVKEDEAIFFLKQICIGFQELKKFKIMHRDLKLENIFLKNNNIVIGDFGFSKFGDIGITNLGSPITMAPEILNKSPVYTDKADLWSIGVMYYQLLFGEYPFTGKNKKYILNDIKNKITDLQFKEDKQKISKQSKDLLIRIFKIDCNERISWDEFFNHKLFKIKNNYSTVFKNKKFIFEGMDDDKINEIHSKTNGEFNKIRTNILTKNLKDRNKEIEDQAIEIGINKNDIFILNKNIYEHYLNMILFFNKGINFIDIIITNKPSIPIYNQLKLITYLIYEKLTIILKNIKSNLDFKLNIFYWDFFEEFLKTEYYNNIKPKYENYQNNLNEAFKNLKNSIKLNQTEIKELEFLNNKENVNNEFLLNQIDDKLIKYLQEIFSIRRKVFNEVNNPNFKRHMFIIYLFIYYIIQSEYYFRHYKNSDLLNWDKFYKKFLIKKDNRIEKKINDL